MPEFIYLPHQNKGAPFADALAERGYTQTGNYRTAKFILADTDYGNRGMYFKRMRILVPIFLYPHAARPWIGWDGLNTPSRRIKAMFVVADGHAEIIRRYGVNCINLVSVGWPFCEMKPFRSTGEIRNVLFAPIHPCANGWLSSVDKNINADTFSRLIKLSQSGVINLTVRHIHSLEQGGLWTEPCVEYIEGKPDLCYQQIDAADVIVAHQTFAHIAVARGKPTVMMSECTPPRWGNKPSNFGFVNSWDKYKDLLMYPLDILAHDDTESILRRAVEGDEEIRDWRARLIGDVQFCGNKFVDTLEGLL